MKVTQYQDGEKCAVSLSDGVVVFPGRLAAELQAVIDAAKVQGALEAKASIRTALGVDDVLENMTFNIQNSV